MLEASGEEQGEEKLAKGERRERKPYFAASSPK